MAIHTQDLLDNALDSFNEALSKYDQGEDGDKRAYKFAILHYAHFLELLFKYYVSRSHRLLIYRNPSSKKLETEQTIGLYQALQFLRNEGRNLDAEFVADIEWLKKLRNQIEHHKFRMDTDKIRLTIGRLTKALVEFNDELDLVDLEDKIGPANIKTFSDLADEYKAEVRRARAKAREESENDSGYLCHICQMEGTAALIDYRYVCMYCGETDPLVDCCVCGDTARESDTRVWNDDRLPHRDLICDGCHDRIMSS